MTGVLFFHTACSVYSLEPLPPALFLFIFTQYSISDVRSSVQLGALFYLCLA
jgi:hypothetical protein